LELVAESLAEPLVAPPDGLEWHTQWSSEHPDYGGLGRRTSSPISAGAYPGTRPQCCDPGHGSSAKERRGMGLTGAIDTELTRSIDWKPTEEGVVSLRRGNGS
jgi:hypothetical protein